MKDWELLDAWIEGDNRSGEALVARYMPMMTRFFHNKVANPEDAAELISDTWLACTSGKQGIEQRRSFRSFLFAAAMNILRTHYRKQNKRKRELDDFEEVCVGDGAHYGTLGSLMQRTEEARLLVRALRRLTLDQQIVLELHVLEGMSGPEIAELLDVPPGTVYTRLRRGKERLRVVMEELAASPELAQSTAVGIKTWAADVRKLLDSG